MASWFWAYLVTQIVEMPIYMHAMRTAPRRWLKAALLSTVTHPIVYFVFPQLFPHDYWNGVVVAEAFAVCAEGLMLSWLGVQRSMSWSILANGASVAIGLTLRALIGWP